MLHGAGSCKESHYDFARAAIALGSRRCRLTSAATAQSDGPMDGRAIDDVVAMASLLRRELGAPGAQVALRGSSMGGYLALRCAEPADAAAVVAICPASASGLRRALNDGALRFDADPEALGELLDAGDLQPVVAQLTIPILLLHAQGDEQVPVQHSRELAAVAAGADQPADRAARAATTARSSTMRSSRRSACASSRRRSGLR